MKASRNKKNSSTDLAIPGVEFGQVEKLLEFMAAHGLEEFEYEHRGLRIRLKKASAAANAAPRTGTPPQALPAQPPAIAGTAPHLTETTAAPSSAAASEELHIIKSPIVGTFYAAAGPGAPPFVKIGDMIQPGQVVCIIEAMKLMNEIEADVSGELVRGLVENGQPVEYGQGLFAIRPARKK
ncbi:MAG: acetyl-CoA carboxylase biotin carboxyl carrier protein [Acidobacteria bacterium]|nr:MAG: acetyl-CoA carboxylase biotin carboxyl carrier protein [Acidobacteriota bacterium]